MPSNEQQMMKDSTKMILIYREYGVPLLNYVPTELYSTFPKLQRIQIESQEISEINSEDFFTPDGNGLIVIKLTSNKITIIRRNTFARLYSLEKLDVSFNQIHTIENGAFDDLSKLTHLSLNENRIKILNENLFNQLVSLKEIELGNNDFEYIGSSLYRLNSVETIRLNHNNISDIDLTQFAKLPHLKTLILLRASENLTRSVLRSSTLNSTIIESNENSEKPSLWSKFTTGFLRFFRIIPPEDPPFESPLEFLDIGFTNASTEAVIKICSMFPNLDIINIGGNGFSKQTKVFDDVKTKHRGSLTFDFDDFDLYFTWKNINKDLLKALNKKIENNSTAN